MQTSDNPAGALLAYSNELAAAVERADRSVVTVHVRQRLRSSGFLWRPGVIVTAAHAIERREEITVTLPSGKGAAATLAGEDPGTDVAVLKVENGDSTVAKVSAGDALKLVHPVLAPGRNS